MHNDTRAIISNDFRNMDPRQRLDLIDKTTNQIGQKGDGPLVLEGRISAIFPGRLTDGKPGGGAGGAPFPGGLERGPAGKPFDIHVDGKGIGGGVFLEGRGGKAFDGLPHPLDGKLLAQLQNLGRFPEVRNSFVDMINRFQEGKLSPTGKEGGLVGLLHGLNDHEINGLKAWLVDSRRNPFDFRQLDGKVQQDISKIFDTLGGRGQEKASMAVLDTLGIRQTLLDGSAMTARTLSGERGQADFHLKLRELSPALQAIISRLQGRDAAASVDSDRTLTGRVNVREDDGRSVVKISDAVRDVMTRIGETTREPGLRPAETRINIADAKADPTLDARIRSTDAKTDARQDETKVRELLPGETKSSSSEQIKDLDPIKKKTSAEEERERLEKEEKERIERENLEKARLEREEKERLERERLAREKQEKEKQDEKKRQSDEERIYIVLPNDTLNSIAGKFFHSADCAEIIYDRNLAEIMLQHHKNQTYAKLYPRQKLIIPNGAFVDSFKRSMKSHKHINFGRMDFGTAEEELAAMFGQNWSGLTGRKPAFSDTDKGEPITRRRFSGNSPSLSDAARRANVRDVLGMSAQDGKQIPKYNVHLGESLRSIAQKLYKSPTYWRLLALKNNLSVDIDQKGNPLAQLRRGQQLSLPDSIELELFAQNLDAPVVVALSTDSRGLDLPLIRHCGNCRRATLAMAANCVSCGVNMDAQVSGNTGEAGRTVPGNDNKGSSKSHRQGRIDAVSPASSRTLHNLQAIPQADLSKVQPGGKQKIDPLWAAIEEPIMMDDSVRIMEKEAIEDDMRCLIVMLQLYSECQWITVFDYHISPDEVVINKYRRNDGNRVMKKTLPARQSKQMAWNHFRTNWQAICCEFWSS